MITPFHSDNGSRRYTPFLLVLIIFLFSGGFFIEAYSRSAPHKYALLVGISKYNRGRDEINDWPDLSGSRDVEMLKKTLMSRFGFKKDDILTLTDENATLEKIKKEFEEHLIAKAEPGDVVFFHFSGHGQQIRDLNGDEMDGRDECFVPYDYGISGVKDMTGNPRLLDDDLASLLAKLADKMRGREGKVKGDIIVVLDTCHSGTGIRTINRRGRPWDEKLDGPEPQASAKKENMYEFAGGGISKDDCVCISACKANEVAMEDPGTDMGVLTELLIKAFEQADASTTYQSLFEKLCIEVASGGWGQNPQIEGNPGKTIFNGSLQPVEPYLLTKPTGNESEIELPAGILNGMSTGSIFEIYRAGSDMREKKNLIAEAKLESVALDHSVARIFKTYGAPDKNPYAAARAVESKHNYQLHLKVYIEGEGAWTEALKNMNIISSGRTDAQTCDIKIYHHREKPLIVLERNDGTTIAGIDENSSIRDDELKEKLLAEWRKRFFASLSNTCLPVEIRVLKVNVKANPSEPPENVEFFGEPEVIKPGDNNEIVFREGDWITFDVRNMSTIPLYVNLLDLDSEGTITPVFPSPDGTGYEDIKQNRLNRLPADGEWHRIPLGIDRKFEKYYYSRLSKPYGREVMKLIATKAPVDLSPLVHRRTILRRGGNDLLNEVSGDNRGLSQLALLLYDTNEGKSRAIIEPVEKSFWGTDEVVFEVRE